jgi:SAM-dependent methyltransferase
MLVRTRRSTRYGLSCGYGERFEPRLLEQRPALRRALDALFDRVLPHDVETLLDLACGTAYYWPLLAPRCRRLVGVELSPAMASAGRHYLVDEMGLGGCMISAEAGRLPIASESVDVVLAIDALHHVADLRSVVGEVVRVLASGGLFVAVEPNLFNPVVFAAHLIPSEERGALWSGHPWAVKRLLSEVFQGVSVMPVTYVSGLQSPGALRFVQLVEPLFQRRPLSSVALRRVYSARRR